MKFHLIVIVWGQAYIERYLRLVLPSHMAPRNLAAFPERADSVYEIHTRPEDVHWFHASPVFRKLQELMPVRLVVAQTAQAEAGDRYEKLIAFTRRAVLEAREAGALLVFLPPDQLCSDGTFPGISRWAHAGKKAIVMPGLRMVQESAEPVLADRWPPEGAGVRGYPPRDLVRIALDHLHPLAASFFTDSPAFLNRWPSHLYWKVPGEGFLCRACHLHPLMVDPRGTDSLGEGTVDGAFLEELCPSPGDVHVVEDSDEMVAVELSRRDQFGAVPPGHANPSMIARFVDAHATRLHESFLAHPIRIHHQDLSPAWQPVERLAEEALARVKAYGVKDQYQPDCLARKVADLRATWEARGARVMLYGAGEHTARLFQWTRIAQANLVGLADGNPALHGQDRHGFRVRSPREILSLAPDVVAISSCYFFHDIYEDIRFLEQVGVELVGFYGPVALSRERQEERL
jgi:hypothetical protein